MAVGSFVQRSGRRTGFPVTKRIDKKVLVSGKVTQRPRQHPSNSFNGTARPVRGVIWVGIASKPGGRIDTVRKVSAAR